jgi:hypothetical protein
MRLFGLLGGGRSINFSQQTQSGIRAFDAGSRRSSGFQLGKALSHGPGVFIGLLRRPGLSRARLEPEIERCRPSSETLRDDGDEALAVPLLVLLGRTPLLNPLAFAASMPDAGQRLQDQPRGREGRPRGSQYFILTTRSSLPHLSPSL